jgi:protein gp37
MMYSKIEWCHHTLNLWWGCTEVHEGCDQCYAKKLAHRWGHDVWGRENHRRFIKSAFEMLDKLQRQAASKNEFHRVFIGSMMDIFEKPMPLFDEKSNSIVGDTGQLREILFDKISNNAFPNLMFLLLTKRPSNINKYIPEGWKIDPPKSVMFGTSVVNQATANTLIPQLLKVKGLRFLSVEPQLEDLSLLEWLPSGDLHWIIQGGESGTGRRPFNLDWGRNLRDECKKYGIAYFFKQVDKVIQIPDDLVIREFYTGSQLQLENKAEGFNLLQDSIMIS